MPVVLEHLLRALLMCLGCAPDVSVAAIHIASDIGAGVQSALLPAVLLLCALSSEYL